MTAYKLNHKITTPKQLPLQPEKLSTITYLLWITTGLGAIALLSSVILLALPLLIVALILGIFAYTGHRYRNYNHANDLQEYRDTVENLWISSKGFIKMRDYFILLGFNSQTAYNIAEELGTDVLAGQNYNQAKGYYPLTNVEGAKVMSAVLVESDLTRKGNLKLTTTILSSV